MNPRPTTRDILELVETATGYPVQLTRDPELPRPATVRMARGPLLAHVITLGAPTLAGNSPDYPICHECGHILRHFARPRGDRWDLGAAPVGQAAVLAQLTEPGGALHGRGLPDEEAARLAGKFHIGILTQLRTVPISLRVDAWLMENYPELRRDQRRAVLEEIRGNAKSLDPWVQHHSPQLVQSASMSMMAAQAAFWADAYRQLALARPYAAEGHLARGRRLLEIFDTIPDDGGHDRDLIDAWAAAIEIAGWYTWVPYDDPA